MAERQISSFMTGQKQEGEGQIKYDVVITKIEGRCIVSGPELSKYPTSPQCENKGQTSTHDIYTSHMYTRLLTKSSLTFQAEIKIIRMQKTPG